MITFIFEAYLELLAVQVVAVLAGIACVRLGFDSKKRWRAKKSVLFFCGFCGAIFAVLIWQLIPSWNIGLAKIAIVAVIVTCSINAILRNSDFQNHWSTYAHLILWPSLICFSYVLFHPLLPF
jgi:hypothetical protein